MLRPQIVKEETTFQRELRPISYDLYDTLSIALFLENSKTSTDSRTWKVDFRTRIDGLRAPLFVQTKGEARYVSKL